MRSQDGIKDRKSTFDKGLRNDGSSCEIRSSKAKGPVPNTTASSGSAISSYAR